MTSHQAVVHGVLSDDNSKLSLWHDPILGDNVPVGDIIERQVELDLLSLPWLEGNPEL